MTPVMFLALVGAALSLVFLGEVHDRSMNDVPAV
jgi:hypothetical protein